MYISVYKCMFIDKTWCCQVCVTGCLYMTLAISFTSFLATQILITHPVLIRAGIFLLPLVFLLIRSLKYESSLGAAVKQSFQVLSKYWNVCSVYSMTISWVSCLSWLFLSTADVLMCRGNEFLRWMGAWKAANGADFSALFIAGFNFSRA